MVNTAMNFANNRVPSVFGNTGRPVSGIPGFGLGHELAAASTAGKQKPNPAAKVNKPATISATTAGIETAAQNAKTAELISILTKQAQGGAPVPGPAGIPPAPNSAAVVQPAPPGPVPPPSGGMPSQIPANPRQQPPREETKDDEKQQKILNGLLDAGQKARQTSDRSPVEELKSDLITRGKLASDSINTFTKFCQLYKKAKQDNSKPSRSSLGEPNGLSYAQRKEDYAQGDDAWNSLNRYRHKQSNDELLVNTFVDTCVANGMSVDSIASAFVKVGFDFGEEIKNELISGLEKIAAPPSFLQSAGRALYGGFGKAPMYTRGLTGLAGGVAGYNSVNPEEDPNFGSRLYHTAMGFAGGAALPGVGAKGGKTGLGTTFGSQGRRYAQSGMNAAVKGMAGGAFGQEIGGSLGRGIDYYREKQLNSGREPVKDAKGNFVFDAAGKPVMQSDNYYRNFFRNAGAAGGLASGGTAGFFGSQAPTTAKAMLPGGALTTAGIYSAYGDDPSRRLTAEYSARGLADAANMTAPGFMSKDPVTGRQVFDKQKAIKSMVSGASDTVANEFKKYFGNFDDYVQEYTNPLFKAIGMHPEQMSALQRYGMLGGGLMAGMGGVMQNPYMLGMGGLMAGAGAYPQLAAAANPYLRSNFGFDLPGAYKPLDLPS